MKENKKGNILKLIPILSIFSLLSIIFITMYVLNYGIIYDYGIYEFQELTEELSEKEVVIPELGNITSNYAAEFRNMPLYLDYIWLIAYIILITGCLQFSYYTRKHNYFSFLSFLFYGTMIILFFVGIFLTVTNWWKDNVLFPMFPNLVLDMPLFYWWLNNIGLNILVIVCTCSVVNLLDFDFSTLVSRSKKEQVALEDEEYI